MVRPKTPLRDRIARWLEAEGRWIKRGAISRRFNHDQTDGVTVGTVRISYLLTEELVSEGLVERREYRAPKGQISTEYRWLGPWAIENGDAPAAEEVQNGA